MNQDPLIVIDPGHGGKDPGCEHNLIVEKYWTLSMGQVVQGLLFAMARANALITRDSDTYMSLRDRAQLSNHWEADLYLSIHVNAARGGNPEPRGMWIIHAENCHRQTEAYAGIVAGILAKQLKGLVPNDWIEVRSDVEATGCKGFTVLRRTMASALLIECGFATNPHDAALLQSPAFNMRLSAALGIAVGSCMGWNNAMVGPQDTCKDTCPDCGGSGACATCGGIWKDECTACSGSGDCEACGGTGEVTKNAEQLIEAMPAGGGFR